MAWIQQGDDGQPCKDKLTCPAVWTEDEDPAWQEYAVVVGEPIPDDQLPVEIRARVAPDEIVLRINRRILRGATV